MTPVERDQKIGEHKIKVFDLSETIMLHQQTIQQLQQQIEAERMQIAKLQQTPVNED